MPEVQVCLGEVDERIYVTISDNGPGIPAPVRRTLFDPFVTAGKPNGTGLGLTLARRIAEEHGGSVRLVESNAGRTVFTMSLTKNRSLPLEDAGSDGGRTTCLQCTCRSMEAQGLSGTSIQAQRDLVELRL